MALLPDSEMLAMDGRSRIVMTRILPSRDKFDIVEEAGPVEFADGGAARRRGQAVAGIQGQVIEYRAFRNALQPFHPDIGDGEWLGSECRAGQHQAQEDRQYYSH